MHGVRAWGFGVAHAADWLLYKRVLKMPKLTFVNEGQELSVSRGDNVRQEALDHGISIYKFKGKLMNCGGYGQCGTCVIEVVEGMSNLSPRTEVEDRKLKRKPDNYRLACQALVQGDASIKTKP
jgi:ferredoxin